MQNDIPIGKTLGSEGNVQWIMGKRSAVNGDKNLFPVHEEVKLIFFGTVAMDSMLRNA